LPEQVLLASDRADAPVAVAMLGRTDGFVDAEQLMAAATEVFGRHRATRSELVDRAGTGGWRTWSRPSPAVVTEVAVATSEDAWSALRGVIHGLDLCRAPLARLLVAHHPAGDWIGVCAHHLAVDGGGLLTLLTETMATYRHPASGPAAPAPAPYVPRTRWRRLVGARLLRLATPRSRFLRPTGRPGAAGFAFVPAVLATPRPARLPDGRTPTVNDLLVAAGHLAAGRWNAQHGRASGTLRLRIPVRGADGGEVDGVSTGFSIVSSDAVLRAAPPRLLAAVVDRTMAAKTRTAPAAPGVPRRLGEALVNAVPARPRAALLRATVSALRPMLMPTAAVGSLGHVPTDLTLGPHGPRLLDLHFTATVRGPQGLVLHATRMAGRVHLTFCHTLELFEPTAAREFVGLFLAAVAELAEPPAASGLPVPATKALDGAT
jgi:hypothetical protein